MVSDEVPEVAVHEHFAEPRLEIRGGVTEERGDEAQHCLSGHAILYTHINTTVEQGIPMTTLILHI